MTATDAARARRSLRRRRALCSLLLLASLLTVVGGLVAAAFGASLFIAGGGALGIVVAFAGLVRLARVRVPSVAAAPVAVPESAPFEPIELAEPEADEHGWTPQPLPKPLHLSRGTIAAMAMASIEAAAELKRAAADAEVARRVEQLEPVVPSIAPAPAPAAGRRGIRSPGDRGREPLRAHGDRRRRRAPHSTTSTPCCVVAGRRAEPAAAPVRTTLARDGRLVLARAHGAVGSASRSQ